MSEEQETLPDTLKTPVTTEEEKKKHPGSENLIPFKPGQCGNPKGRPRGVRTFKFVLNKYLDDEINIDETKDGLGVKTTTKRDILCLKLIKIAEANDDMNAIRAIEQIMNRVDGKPEQPLVGDIDKPITMVINNAENEL